MLPALGALALWKYRGYGTLPAFGNAYVPQRLALGPDAIGPPASVFTPYHKYANIDWSHLQNNLDGLAEVFFSLRVLEFLPFAGAIAVARRSWALAIALSTWFWLYFVIKGSDSVASVDSGSFFRLLLPAIPPLLIMVACLPVLVPRFGPMLAKRYPVPVPRIPGKRLLIAAGVLFAFVPLVAAAALQPIGGEGRSIIVHEIAVPVDTGIDLRATVAGGTVRLDWNAARAQARRGSSIACCACAVTRTCSACRPAAPRTASSAAARSRPPARPPTPSGPVAARSPTGSGSARTGSTTRGWATSSSSAPP